jgi:hypothetical protein
MSLQMEIGLNAIASYRRLDYEIWYALAEFVDNSTQSFLNHRDELEAAYEQEGEGLAVRITYERTGRDQVLRIADNAMGMDLNELTHALKVAFPPENPTGRCRYGMGMKTASCWIGNKWWIRTKKLGETTEYTVVVDVKAIEEGNAELPTKERENVAAGKHYTVIEIRDHNREFKGRTIQKIKDHLRSIYRADLRNQELILSYNGDELEWQDFDDRLRKDRSGEIYKRPFEFEVEGKRVHGWAGILDRGSRADTGFSIMHANRVVRGWPDAWRPEKIFGIQRNDLLNQRLLGEIHLDAFEVTHTKDNIQWFGDEQEQVEKKLQVAISDLINVAKTPWKDQTGDGGPGEGEIDMAISQLRDELLSPEMVDKLSLVDLPEEDVIGESMRRISGPVKAKRRPDIEAKVGDLDVWVYVIADSDLGHYDPYVLTETSADGHIVVIINLRHPHVREIRGQDALINYFRHCVYDAVAEWKAQQLRSRLDPNTVKMLKDGLLRVSFAMEQHADEGTEEA